MASSSDDEENKPLIMFSTCKRELLNPTNGLRQLHRRLKNNFRVDVNKDEVSLDCLKKANLHIFAGPREPFDKREQDALKYYVKGGGNLVFMLSEGGDVRLGTNLNELFADWGIEVRPDAVVRTVFFRYFHPKEVCITHGIVNRALDQAAGKNISGEVLGASSAAGGKEGDVLGRSTKTGQATSVKEQVADSTLVFVYPYGSSLNVEPPAVPLLSSGFIAYPLQRPIAAVYEDKKSKGRVLVVGSLHMWHDDWLGKEENQKLWDVLASYLLKTQNIKLNEIDKKAPHIEEHHLLPDTAALASRLRVCLEKPADLPRDFTELLDTRPFRFDTDLVPEALAAYEELDLKHEPLTLIQPQFEVPLPPLQPAVFGPALKEEPPPALDLFDLDEHFASERIQLATLTNKCGTEDLEFYIKEVGEVLGITRRLAAEKRGDARAVLEEVLTQIVNFKKLNNEGALGETTGVGGGGGPGEGVSFWKPDEK
eukprot:TRINITY_DN2133_c0_g1_i1.p1 TRINITY_DN2133_c0_g1~~TRINITY_DN2133_c0_g1_i1.p1  ORF type:complete len:482 (-),score=122.34 TRINITY_DN2133_c0_g1_i1:1389-2834(-)